MRYLIHSKNERDAPEVWNLIRNNDPSLTHLRILLFGTPTPSFYQNLAKDLQDNSNITHLRIQGAYDIKYIPNLFQPIFESSKFINTLEIDSLDDLMDKIHAIVDDVFDSLIKSKNNKKLPAKYLMSYFHKIQSRSWNLCCKIPHIFMNPC